MVRFVAGATHSLPMNSRSRVCMAALRSRWMWAESYGCNASGFGAIELLEPDRRPATSVASATQPPRRLLVHFQCRGRWLQSSGGGIAATSLDQRSRYPHAYPHQNCFRRSAVAVLASGVVISMSALTGGVAPAFAKPGTTVIRASRSSRHPRSSFRRRRSRLPSKRRHVRRRNSRPLRRSRRRPSSRRLLPRSKAPPPQVRRPAASEPVRPPRRFRRLRPRPRRPRSLRCRSVDTPKVAPSPRPRPTRRRLTFPRPTHRRSMRRRPTLPQVDTPKADAPKVDAPKVDAPAPLPAVGSARQAGRPEAGCAGPEEPGAGADSQKATRRRSRREAAASQSTRRRATRPTRLKGRAAVPTARPSTMQAPEQDIQLARQSKPIEVKPEPAKKEDVDFLSSSLNMPSKNKLGPFESEFNVGSEFSVGGDRDRDRGTRRDWDKKHWDKKVRQWDRNWIEYDEYYRPIIFNPFRAPVRIVYVLRECHRGSWSSRRWRRVVVDAAEFAAYSFTAVVLGAANAVDRRTLRPLVNVAVGTFFGGGYIPAVGLPFCRRLRCAALRQRAGSGAVLERDVPAVPGQPDRRRRRRRPVRRAEGAARRSDACVGAVDHVADGRAAVRGASHAAVPRVWANRRRRRCPATTRCGWRPTSPPTSTARRCS